MASLQDILGGVLADSDDDDDMATPVHRVLARVKAYAKREKGCIPFVGRYHRHPRNITDDYILTSEVLGAGASGEVRVARSKHRNGTMFAVKKTPLTDMRSMHLKIMQEEVAACLCLDHPHIARLVAVYETSTVLFLVTEVMAGGDLSDRVEKVGKFAEDDAAEVITQILLALNYMHHCGVTHRDIKHGNILFDSENSNNLKLIDFGFSKHETHISSQSISSYGLASCMPPLARRSEKMKTVCGTDGYMAPEIRGTEGYTSKVDLWSVGVILFHLLTGTMPFHESPTCEGREAILEQGLLGVSASAADFTKLLLSWDCATRPSAPEALEHPWIGNCRAKRCARGLKPFANSLRSFGQMPKLRCCCLKMVAWSLSSEERARVQDVFVALNTNRHGVIEREELESLIGHEADAVLQHCAASDRGRCMCYSEFLAAVVADHIGLHDDLLNCAYRCFETTSSDATSGINLRRLGSNYLAMDSDNADSYVEETMMLSVASFVDLARGGKLGSRASPNVRSCCVMF
eukprot:TRINITY_DN62118_c0_g1_i1.p1 TRINITY_DN62118_c0_g1~~TRINITY_DN62118_c0_g1_i1.p1  ORF type:complete len:520 (-),score=66.65 TRINITY_DN62118_c0_g1_i1:97-1656(-)